MKRQSNILSWQWFALALLVWLLPCSHARAVSASERSWQNACKLFADSRDSLMWGIVEETFAKFMKDHPSSDHYPDAVVFEARAKFEQGKYDQVIDLLSAQASRADHAADQFAYWTARAYAKKLNFDTAADTFARLVRENTNSPLRLEAVFREAQAHAQLKSWPRVIEELQEPNGVFQQIARTNLSDDLVVSGFLLLGEAQLAQTNYAAVESTLSALNSAKLRPDLEWDRQSLLCRAQITGGQLTDALQTSKSLLDAAGTDARLRARSITLKGQILEAMADLPGAIQIYEINLDSDLPAERREALLRIVELALRQNHVADAAKRLNDFLVARPEEKGADFERLMLGELRLREYYQSLAGGMLANGPTNLLSLAEVEFEKLAGTNGDYRGKAELNLGWCFLAEGRLPESQIAFSNALAHLPFSEDQAVAQFKLADIRYQQQDYPGAVDNYNALIANYASLAAVKDDLFEPALYHILQASLDQTNLTGADEAMNRILEWFPNGLLGDRSMLLVGQSQTPADARKVFSELRQRSPGSSLLPEAMLAVARTYEKETNWSDAINQYNLWVEAYTNSPALPRAEFARAWANYKAGNESNAFVLFTNFVTRFRTNDVALSNDLPARAQYWVGDYFWRREPPEFQKSEIGYEEVFTKWPNSPLAFQAQMMAGRAAMGRQDPRAAINYFTSLTSSSNCPSGLAAQALLLNGDATLALPASSDATNYSVAIPIFRYIATKYTNSPIAAQAWGRLGDCYFALAANAPADYETATNAFNMAIESSFADATARSMAELRMGQALEAMARLKPTGEQKPLFAAALLHFLNVLHGSNLHEGEQPDLYWVKEAGVAAAALSEELGEWRQAKQFYQELQTLAPPMRGWLEKKIARVEEHLSTEKH